MVGTSTEHPNWIEQQLCMVMDTVSGVKFKFAAGGSKLVGTEDEAKTFVQKVRVPNGKEERSVIVKIDALVYKE